MRIRAASRALKPRTRATALFSTHHAVSAMRILFITSASHSPSQSGYNHFQRVEFLSRNADLTLWARKGADFAASATPGTPVSRAAIGGKLGLFLHVLGNALAGRAREFDIVLTEPSLLSLTGPCASSSARANGSSTCGTCPDGSGESEAGRSASGCASTASS